MYALTVENLSVAYDKKTVLENACVTVPTGHLAAIIGPNGAGKSTFLKAILNQLPNKVGKVEILGKMFEPKSLVVGYVPQRNAVDWDFLQMRWMWCSWGVMVIQVCLKDHPSKIKLLLDKH